MQRFAGVMQQHAWSRETHDYLHFFFHVRSVAVDEAFSAGALLLLKRAFVQTHMSVCQKFGAFGAEFAVGFMVGFAVNVDHVFDGFLFATYSRVFLFGLFNQCHVNLSGQHK